MQRNILAGGLHICVNVSGLQEVGVRVGGRWGGQIIEWRHRRWIWMSRITYIWHSITIYNNLRVFCTFTDSKLEHQHTKGQNSHIYHSEQQGDEEREKFPRLPHKTAQFCGLLRSEKLSKLCGIPSVTNSWWFGSSCKFSIWYRSSFCLCVQVWGWRHFIEVCQSAIVHTVHR